VVEENSENLSEISLRI